MDGVGYNLSYSLEVTGMKVPADLYHLLVIDPDLIDVEQATRVMWSFPSACRGQRQARRADDPFINRLHHPPAVHHEERWWRGICHPSVDPRMVADELREYGFEDAAEEAPNTVWMRPVGEDEPLLA